MRPNAEQTRVYAAWTLSMGAFASCAVLLLGACNQVTVRTTAVEPVTPLARALPQTHKLDLGIEIFDPGFANIDEHARTTTPSVRRAESYYMALRLRDTLAGTGNWGRVVAVPAALSETEVRVRGEILRSDGATLELNVAVSDAMGRPWFEKRYREQVSRYAYEADELARREPFQNLYNGIASDIEAYLQGLSGAEVQTLQAVAELSFAQRFAAEPFAAYLATDGRGRRAVARLPAHDDPVLQRVRRIRERDDAFVATLQTHYDAFSQRLRTAYDQWRQESYHETRELEQLERAATQRKIGGAVAVAAGVLAQTADSGIARAAGVVGIAGGAMAFKSGLDMTRESRIHGVALAELADSFSAELQPYTIALGERTVTLTGTVEEQYAQWRDLLAEIYHAETGDAAATGGADR